MFSILKRQISSLKPHLYQSLAYDKVLDLSNLKALNSLPNNTMLNWSKLKADDKINVNEKLNFGIGRVENIVGKGQNAGYHHFLLFP